MDASVERSARQQRRPGTECAVLLIRCHHDASIQTKFDEEIEKKKITHVQSSQNIYSTVDYCTQ